MCFRWSKMSETTWNPRKYWFPFIIQKKWRFSQSIFLTCASLWMGHTCCVYNTQHILYMKIDKLILLFIFFLLFLFCIKKRVLVFCYLSPFVADWTFLILAVKKKAFKRNMWKTEMEKESITLFFWGTLDDAVKV